MNETKQDSQKQSDDEKEPAKVEFSLPQILGGALAAVTVAVVGSSLGTAGTIAGAAIASVVGGVAGTLYTAGLDHTTRGIRSVAQRGLQRSGDAETPGALGTPGAPGAPEGDSLTLPADIFVEPPTLGEQPPDKRNWKSLGLRILVSAVAIFAVAFAAITVYELTVGNALDGSKGTTIGGTQRVATTKPTTTPKSTPTATPTTSTTPAASTPVATPTVTPTATATQAVEPTATATATSPAAEPTSVASAAATGQSTP